MAAGEYVWVSSQADTEKADLARETAELKGDPKTELNELAGIYIARGLEPELAVQVAKQLTPNDALGAHMRDELGLSESTKAKPVQAALTSPVMFSAGAALPLAVAPLAPTAWIAPAVAITTPLGFLQLWARSALAQGPRSKLFKNDMRHPDVGHRLMNPIQIRAAARSTTARHPLPERRCTTLRRSVVIVVRPPHWGRDEL